MNSSLKAKWVAALRSSDYAQTTGILRDEGNGYCCLGVLCEVSGLGDWDGSQYVVYDDGDTLVCDGELSEPVEEIIGLGSKTQSTLIKMNDGQTHPEPIRQHTFAEIADYIEANL